MFRLGAAYVRMNQPPLDRREYCLRESCRVEAGTMTTLTAFTGYRNSNPRRTGMPKEAHTKAAEHHENAAKSHRTAAEHHGKGEHAKGHEESTKAQSHSKTAREHSDIAHGKSQSHK
jgi:hypothetical protein